MIDTGFLVWMGMEGDNRDDATFVASVIAKVLSTDDKIEGHQSILIFPHHTHLIYVTSEWKQPESWRQGLFGTLNDNTLFG